MVLWLRGAFGASVWLAARGRLVASTLAIDAATRIRELLYPLLNGHLCCAVDRPMRAIALNALGRVSRFRFC